MYTDMDKEEFELFERVYNEILKDIKRGKDFSSLDYGKELIDHAIIFFTKTKEFEKCEILKNHFNDKIRDMYNFIVEEIENGYNFEDYKDLKLFYDAIKFFIENEEYDKCVVINRFLEEIKNK